MLVTFYPRIFTFPSPNSSGVLDLTLASQNTLTTHCLFFFYRQGLAYYTRKFALYKVISYLTSLWEWTFARAIAFQILSNENKLLKAFAKLSYIYFKLTKPIWNLNTVCIYIWRLNHQQQCDKHICTSLMAPNLP